MCRPTASAAVQPKMRSAAGFQDVMMPSSVLLTIASSDESMRVLQLGDGQEADHVSHAALHASRRASLSEPPMSDTARSAVSSTRPMPTKPWIIPPKET